MKMTGKAMRLPTFHHFAPNLKLIWQKYHATSILFFCQHYKWNPRVQFLESLAISSNILRFGILVVGSHESGP